MSDTTIIHRPRVIVELKPDGTLVLEQYLDGQRQQMPLPLGFELFEIREALRAQVRRHESAQERKARAKEEAETRRHSQVWRYVAENHGIGFANRTINGVASSKMHAKVDEKAKKPSPTLKEALSLL